MKFSALCKFLIHLAAFSFQSEGMKNKKIKKTESHIACRVKRVTYIFCVKYFSYIFVRPKKGRKRENTSKNNKGKLVDRYLVAVF